MCLLEMVHKGFWCSLMIKYYYLKGIKRSEWIMKEKIRLTVTTRKVVNQGMTYWHRNDHSWACGMYYSRRTEENPVWALRKWSFILNSKEREHLSMYHPNSFQFKIQFKFNNLISNWNFKLIIWNFKGKCAVCFWDGNYLMCVEPGCMERWMRGEVGSEGVISGDHGVQWLEAGHCLQSLKKEFNKETEIVKQVEHLLEPKYVWKNTQVDSEWVTHYRSGSNHLYGGSFLGSFWPINLLLPMFDLTQGPLLCPCASFSQDGFQCKGFWKLGRTHYGLSPPSLLWPVRICSVGCVVWAVSLTTRVRKMWLPYLFTQAGLCSYCIFIKKCQPTGAWDPANSCLRRAPDPHGLSVMMDYSVLSWGVERFARMHWWVG